MAWGESIWPSRINWLFFLICLSIASGSLKWFWLVSYFSVKIMQYYSYWSRRVIFIFLKIFLLESFVKSIDTELQHIVCAYWEHSCCKFRLDQADIWMSVRQWNIFGNWINLIEEMNKRWKLKFLLWTMYRKDNKCWSSSRSFSSRSRKNSCKASFDSLRLPEKTK